MARSPRISGAPLKNLARFARTRVGGIAMQRVLRSDLAIDRLSDLPDEFRAEVPLDTRPHPGRPPRARADDGLPWPDAGWAPGALALGRAYREGASPVDVASRAIEESKRLAALEPTVGPIQELAAEALDEARAAEARIREGRAKGPLDGVPWVVKEHTAVRGLQRRSGTAFVDDVQAKDGTAVHRARERGIVTIGTTVMTEYGMTPSGVNAKRRMPRNPHALDRFAGGSSTGSGVAVATGLVPFALGADGGGSIRIPAALNGVFGIKPTWGRVSRAGDDGGGSVAHDGPLACSTVDLAYLLEAISGHDGDDPQTFAAPTDGPGAPSAFLPALSRGVRGLVIGVPDGEWADAAEPVVRAGRAALAALEKEGARLVPIEVPLAKYAPAIGVVIIACEARAGLRTEWREHADDMSDDLQITMAVLDAFSATEYLDICRLRAGLRAQMAAVLREVDLVALPSVVAPAARVTDAEMASGFLDTKVIAGLCRYAFLGNLTGLPALSAPVGCDASGLPVGLQLMGDAWDEATILSASAHLERIGAAVVRRPRVTAKIL